MRLIPGGAKQYVKGVVNDLVLDPIIDQIRLLNDRYDQLQELYQEILVRLDGAADSSHEPHFLTCHQNLRDLDLALVSLTSYADYARYMEDMNKEHNRRRLVESGLIPDAKMFVVPGFCYVCRRHTRFKVSLDELGFQEEGQLTPNWREHLICPRCQLSNRMRASLHILEQVCGPTPETAIYITEQITDFFRVLSRRYSHLIGSEFLGQRVPLGTTDDQGVRNEDITHLSFDSGALDIILSFEVLEHVPDYRQAVRECWRCLKPGGRLLLSAPFTWEPRTTIRARLNPDGSVTHLLPPEYHGDPLSSSGCLCFTHFGWELLDDLRGAGFEHPRALHYWSLEFGYLGYPNQVCFLAYKPLSAAS
jgi:SAM-dependent methyltransferase